MLGSVCDKAIIYVTRQAYLGIWFCSMGPSVCPFIDKIESVQEQFLLFSLRHLHWNSDFVLPPYISRLKLIGLPSLRCRRVMLNTVMVLKVLNGDVSSDYIISKIKINVPFRPTRYYQFLHIDFQRTRKVCFCGAHPQNVYRFQFSVSYHRLRCWN